LAAGLALSGDYAFVGLLVLVLVAGGRFVAPEVALFSEAEFGLPDGLSFRCLAVSTVAWAAVFVVLAAADAPEYVLSALPFAAALVCLPAYAALASEGRVDTDAGVAHLRERDLDLDDVASVARYDLGPLTVLRLRYHEGAGYVSAPRVFGVLCGDAAAVRAALESSDAPPPAVDGNPLVAKTLHAFGAGAFALAAGFAAFAYRQGGDAAVVGAYGATFAALFGALFVWAGRQEG
ncbi:MAG: hypothetical protein ABEH83_13190, partial [Halobacterium sp.]